MHRPLQGAASLLDVQLHDGEVRATTEMVRALVADQCPEWADLTVTPVDVALEGTDHVMYRLGDSLVARFPKLVPAADQDESDARWLERLAPQLPVALPLRRHLGDPGGGYPWRWSVVDWIAGETLPRLGVDDPQLATDLAEFTRALHAIDPTGGPRKAPGSRGAPLHYADEHVRAALKHLRTNDDGFDVDAAEAAWERCVAAPGWPGDPVWLHADLQPGNLVTRDGRLAGVIDVGSLGVGDPAPDLAAALWTFTGASRAVYRETLALDDATWLRACGWALAPALTGVDYYRHSFPRMAEHGRLMVTAVIAEVC